MGLRATNRMEVTRLKPRLDNASLKKGPNIHATLHCGGGEAHPSEAQIRLVN
jgi:hypothetical protein